MHWGSFALGFIAGPLVQVTIDAEGGKFTSQLTPCDHVGKKKIYSRGTWKCECGRKLEDSDAV